MKDILIPTDFSTCADHALDFGIEYAKKNNAKINLLHILKTPINWVNIPKDKEKDYPGVRREISVAKNNLKEREKKVKENGLSVHKMLVYNQSNTDCFKNTTFHHYDMVIMGSHGASGPKELLFGSNAEYLINHVSIPVLIIKEAIISPIKKIAFLSDYKDSFVKSFPTLLDFANYHKAEIDLLHINLKAFPAIEKESKVAFGMNRIERYFPRKKPYAKHIIYHENVEQATDKYCEEHDVDMISLVSTKKAAGIFSFLQPSISKKIANHSKLPILILRN